MQSKYTANIKRAFTAVLEWLNNNKSFIWLLLVPMVLLTVYYGLIATDRYVSESKLVVKKTDQPDTSSSSIASALGASSGKEDALYLKEYMQSYDMLDFLDKKLALRKAYQSKDADYFSRLSRFYFDVTKEDFFNYYLKHVDVVYDDNSNVLTVRVDTFRPAYSQQVNQLILNRCEQFMNDVSHKIADEQMHFVDAEVVKVKDRMEEAKVRMAEFQNKYNVVDPVAQATAAASMVADMEKSLAGMEADLSNLRTFVREDSYQVITMKNKLKTLREQIAREKKLLASSGDNHLNAVALQFINLKTDLDYVVGVYQADLAALEKARFDASRKLKNVVVLEFPTLQEEAEYPRKLYNLATIFLVLLGVYGIIRMVAATIKEHKE